MAPSTFAPGHNLVNRYRIRALLGVGQTAEVYLAEDLSLLRSVVVKVLLPRLAGHEDVRRAFRDRIVRAATLSHPHLARVFDGGQESGAIFMICEYLSGGSLEDVLASGRTLSVDDGARLGRDVASALAYVHANGFVHGSLSPSKLLLDDEGRVRVSDIALAGLGAAYRDRLTLDDVRFLSPEQAIGDPPSPKSDVYALALIMFEAVTGVTPFEGLTPEAVLRARINAALPMRLELGTLDMLLAQAAVPDPLLRLDAEQLSSRLGMVVSDFAPLVVAPVRGEVPLLSQFQPAEPRNSVGFRPPSADQITGASPVVAGIRRAGAPRHARPDEEFVTNAGPVGPVRRTPRPDFDNLDYDRGPRTRRLAFLAAALLLLVVAIGGGVAWKIGFFSQNNSVPDLVGKDLLNLSKPSNPISTILHADGFTLAVRRAHSSTVKAGLIISQTPAALTTEKSGTVITVTVSNGSQIVTMPTNLVGETCAVARTELTKKHVHAQCPTSHEIASSVVPVGDVARVIRNGVVNPPAVPIGATVILELSTGPSTTTTTAPSATTTTTPGTTPTTTTTLATQPLISMPNLVGKNQSQVHAAMNSAGLYYTTKGPGAGANPTWTQVVSSVPAAGTKVKKFSKVLLNVK